MDDDDLRDLISAVRDLLRPHLERSEPLRRVVRHVGALLVEESRRAGTVGADDPDRSTAVTAAAAFEATSTDRSPEPVDPGITSSEAGRPEPVPLVAAQVPLNVGGTSVRVPVRGTPGEIERAHVAQDTETAPGPVLAGAHEHAIEHDEIDLALIEKRCRLKAESCRFYIKRRAAEGDPISEPPILDRMNEMIAEAKAMPRCFLWVFWRGGTQPDDATLEVIGRCYDAVGHAAGLLNRLDRLGKDAIEGDLQEAFNLGAEAVSALRVAMTPTWLTSPDADQKEFHHWLREESSARDIFVPRFMTLDDRADPFAVEDLRRRLRTLDGDVTRHADRLKQIKEGFKTLKYHVGLLTAGHEGGFDDYHFRRIAETIDMLADLGVPYSDRRFRRLIDEGLAESLRLHGDCPPAVVRVLGSVQDWRAGLTDVEPTVEGPQAGQWSEHVRELRPLLAGGAVVMIGGEPRNDAADRIKDAFDLEDLVWVRLSEHGTGQRMRAPISRPETRLVIVLVKLTGHIQAEEAIACAKAADKPLVMLKAGYNPEQIAAAALQQASEQLRAIPSGH